MKKVSTREGIIIFYQKRNQALLYIVLTIICITILGVSLSDLQFLPGLPFPGAESSSVYNPTTLPDPFNKNNSSPWILQIVLAVGVILILFFLIIALLKKINYKLISLITGVLVILFTLFSVLTKLSPSQFQNVTEGTSPTEQLLSEYQVAPIGDPPTNLFIGVKVGLMLAIIVIFGRLIVHVFKPSQKDNKLADEVESAIQAITEGVNLGGVIIRCYLNMENAISEELGIDRGQSKTPHEFETYLIDKGIPKAPIQLLTTLFEKARYGNQCLAKEDELDALSSLFAIQKACETVMERDR